MVNVLEPIVHLLHVKTPSTCVKDNYTACTIKVQDKKKEIAFSSMKWYEICNDSLIHFIYIFIVKDTNFVFALSTYFICISFVRYLY